jgi:chorismate mutase/prephenate dehydratase
MADPTRARGTTTRRRRQAAETPELRGLRQRIDAIDRRLVALMNERAELAIAAGRAKVSAGRHGIRDARREAEVLERVAQANDGPLTEADLRSVWRRVMSATRALEARDRGRERTDV